MKIISKNLNKAVIYYNNEFYLVSEANNEFTDFQQETLIFRCNPVGEVSDWGEIGGGKYVSLDEVLNNIIKYIY